MLCQAPELPISLARQQQVPERPDEFGFKLDDVQALMALNATNFIYYPNPEFEPLSVSGVLELKPGSPIILKVRRETRRFAMSSVWIGTLCPNLYSSPPNFN